MDDIKQKLAALGLPTEGEWLESTTNPKTPAFLDRQKRLLVQLRALLQAQLETEKGALKELHTEKLRLGGEE